MIQWEKWADPYLELINKFEADGEGEYPFLPGEKGPVPLSRNTVPSAVFRLWVAHTDFPLGKNERRRIAEVVGVESLDIETRYRFRLGIGKAFDEETVKKSVERACRLAGSPKGKDAVAAVLSSTFPAWARYVMPTGLVEYAAGQTPADARKKGEAYDSEACSSSCSWLDV